LQGQCGFVGVAAFSKAVQFHCHGALPRVGSELLMAAGLLHPRTPAEFTGQDEIWPNLRVVKQDAAKSTMRGRLES
jgi:hypothetical protein